MAPSDRARPGARAFDPYETRRASSAKRDRCVAAETFRATMLCYGGLLARTLAGAWVRAPLLRRRMAAVSDCLRLVSAGSGTADEPRTYLSAAKELSAKDSICM